MGWIRWTGKALEITGEVMQAEGFEEWAERKGRALIEKYTIDQVKASVNQNNAMATRPTEDRKISDATLAKREEESKHDVSQTFKEFMNHAGFKNKLNREIRLFQEELGDTFSYLESNQFIASRYLYALPRMIAHDRLDRRLLDSLSVSGDLASLNTQLAAASKNVEADFLSYFVPTLRSSLMDSIESIDFGSRDNWPRLGTNWLLIDCDKTSRWKDENACGYYVGTYSATPLGDHMDSSVRRTTEQLSVQIFDLSAQRRLNIIDSINERLKSKKKFGGMDESPAEIKATLR